MITRLHIKRHTGQMQGRGCTIDGNCVCATAIFSYSLFKCRNLRPLGKKLRGENGYNRLDIAFIDILLSIGNQVCFSYSSAKLVQELRTFSLIFCWKRHALLHISCMVRRVFHPMRRCALSVLA